jgi:hypothetical protein
VAIGGPVRLSRRHIAELGHGEKPQAPGNESGQGGVQMNEAGRIAFALTTTAAAGLAAYLGIHWILQLHG